MSNQIQPSFMGSLAMLATTAANTTTNTLKMIDNLAVAGERVTHIARSKATNIAEISEVQDSDRKSTRLNSSHSAKSRMPSSA